MRVNWFAPLPPEPSPTAALTARLLPLLGERAEVVVWTDQESWDSSATTHAAVRRYQGTDLPWADLNRGDVTVYHLGLGHGGGVRAVLGRHPGVVVLPDGLEPLPTALGVVVSARDDFDRLRRTQRWPVALLTPADDRLAEYAQALLHFAATVAGRSLPTALDLTHRVAGEWLRWGGGRTAGVGPVVKGICEIFQ